MSNGMGGIDWAGLDYIAEFLGVSDIEALTDALLCIRLHKPESEDSD